MSKIVTLVLVGVLSLALVGGSAYILLRPGEAAALDHSVERAQGSGGENQGRGGSGSVEREPAASGGYGRGGQSQGGSKDAAGQGRGAGGAAADSLADHPAEAWAALSGTVTALEDGVLTVETADGVLEAHLGPEWYWEAAGVALVVGDEVAVTGFDENGEFEVAAVENLTTGESIALREEGGRPPWAGRGRGGH